MQSQRICLLNDRQYFATKLVSCLVTVDFVRPSFVFSFPFSFSFLSPLREHQLNKVQGFVFFNLLVCTLNLISETGLRVTIFAPDSNRLALYYVDFHSFGSPFNLLHDSDVARRNPKSYSPSSSLPYLTVGSSFYLFIHVAYIEIGIVGFFFCDAATQHGSWPPHS